MLYVKTDSLSLQYNNTLVLVMVFVGIKVNPSNFATAL